MAEKKTGKEEFEAAVYALGLKLIEDYTTGNCRDRSKTIDAITEIFKTSVQKNG